MLRRRQADVEDDLMTDQRQDALQFTRLRGAPPFHVLGSLVDATKSNVVCF